MFYSISSTQSCNNWHQYKIACRQLYTVITRFLYCHPICSQFQTKHRNTVLSISMQYGDLLGSSSVVSYSGDFSGIFLRYQTTVTSGARTHLEVGGTPVRRQVVPLHFFGSKSTISRFGERFRNGQYISLVSFLFAVLLLTVPLFPSHL